MGLNRNITDAVMPLQQGWHYLAEEWPKQYPDEPQPRLGEVFRTSATQRAYFAQGREKLSIVNSLRRAAGLDPINEAENRRKVTQRGPGSSKHELYPSRAMDLIFVRVDIVDGRAKQTLCWDQVNFKRAAQLIRAKFPAIVWGGDWDSDGRSDDERFVDMPHFEI